MIQLITGEKGKGKTPHLLDKVNSEIKNVSGSIVFLDKSKKHMYELNNKVRLIDVTDYILSSEDEFYGFICGILSSNHDVQQIYVDNFFKVANLETEDLTKIMEKLDLISNKFNVDFICSVGINANQLPEFLKSKVIISL